MCGRYVLALSPSQIRRILEDDDMPVYDAPEDEGAGAPRQSYNFAPGYHGIVYRADVPDWGAGPAREHSSRSKGSTPKKRKGAAPATSEESNLEDEPASISEPALGSQAEAAEEPHYIMQSMKWGLIPFWTKRNPDYASMLKTINARDDSLATPGGMWNTMKARKRCIVVAQGFFEWLKPGGPGTKEKVPHYIKRKDGKLMCFAGLWDCVRYEDEPSSKGGTEGEPLEGVEPHRHYTYTIITTDSNTQLKFLHDRMPVILEPGSEALRVWLDPGRHEWTMELQRLLKPFAGELEVYAVSKEVGKVGNNSASFIVPVASKENKSNIANFFANAKGAKSNTGGKEGKKSEAAKVKPEVEVEIKLSSSPETTQKVTRSVSEEAKIADDGVGSNTRSAKAGLKRSAPSPSKDLDDAKHLAKKVAGRPTISATANPGKSPIKAKTRDKEREAGAQKITKFFANSA